MATLATNSATLTDIAKRTEAIGLGIDKVIEALLAVNPVLDDIPWIEANNGMTHRTTVRATLPEIEFRAFNEGVHTAKSETIQVEDGTAMAQVYAEIDKKLVQLNGNTMEYRRSEDVAFIEAMGQKQVATMFYGNSKLLPKEYTGFSPRFGKIGENVQAYSDGAGDENASVWLIPWGEQTVHGIYPRGMQAGMNVTDLGEVTLEDANGGKYQGYRTNYEWDCGLSVRDSRYIQRVANIKMADIDDLIVNGTTSANTEAFKLIRLMTEAVNRLPSIHIGNPIWYMHKRVKSMLDILASEKMNVYLQIEYFEGKPVTMFLGHPVKQLDGLLTTEQAVAA